MIKIPIKYLKTIQLILKTKKVTSIVKTGKYGGSQYNSFVNACDLRLRFLLCNWTALIQSTVVEHVPLSNNNNN